MQRGSQFSRTRQPNENVRGGYIYGIPKPMRPDVALALTEWPPGLAVKRAST
jgi:hypothetical protein